METILAAAATGCASVLAAYLSNHLIAEFIPLFLKRNLCGVDQCKKENAEPMGVIVAAVYMIVMSAFLPFPFYRFWSGGEPLFPHHNFVEFLSGLLSICCMVFLGFADDVIDLKWRQKFTLPGLAAIPLLMVYWANFNSTHVIVPKLLTPYLGASVDIGVLYYIYMVLMAIFCTHAINILAGINGLETGQSLVISGSIIVFNIVQLYRLETEDWYHYLSLYFMLPYFSVTMVLHSYNRYPASVFVGDTFCYFSGMTFAVCAILGHFSKTAILFFLPQIANFLYSLPQLFRLVPCPRHRLPKYNPATDKVQMSMARFKENDLNSFGKLSIAILHRLHLLHREVVTENGENYVEVNNMTIINLCLKFFGPMHEKSLTQLLLFFHVLNSCLVFFGRFVLASFVYDTVH